MPEDSGEESPVYGAESCRRQGETAIPQAFRDIDCGKLSICRPHVIAPSGNHLLIVRCELLPALREAELSPDAPLSKAYKEGRYSEAVDILQTDGGAEPLRAGSLFRII